MFITSSLQTRWENINVNVNDPESPLFKDGRTFTLLFSHGETLIFLTKDNLLTLMHECEAALHHYNEISGDE